MASPMDTLFALAVSPQLDEQFGEAVTLRRGIDITADVNASWINHNDEVSDVEGLTSTLVDRAWLVLVTDYKIAGAAVTPRAGDRLTDATGRVWEAFAPPDKPAWHLAGDGEHWVILTRRVT